MMKRTGVLMGAVRSVQVMEINMKINAGSVNSVTPAKRSAPAAASAAAEGAFADSTALDASLKGTPDVRPEAVERAKALISDPNYPSADTVAKLSNFLAAKLQSGPE